MQDGGSATEGVSRQPDAQGAADDAPFGTGPHAVVYSPGCTAQTLTRNDDRSTGFIALKDQPSPVGPAFPAGLDFFGSQYDGLYVNNNGNVTFTGPLSTFTPFPLQASADAPMIAPFFADVDTRNSVSAEVTYGITSHQGRPAFCVLWAGVGVGYFPAGADKLNEFQLLLVDRSDVGAGDFDIVFNYDQVQWEAGSASGGSGGLGGSTARAGYTNGTDTGLELNGSGVVGGLLDGNLATGLIRNSLGLPLLDTQLGRYLFRVRNGAPPPPGTVGGDLTTVGGAAVAGATVSVCGGDDLTTGAVETVCRVTTSNGGGRYDVAGLVPGAYEVRVSPPGDLLPALRPAIVPTTQDVDIVLEGPTPPPAGTTVGGGNAAGGTPVVIVGAPFTISVPCAAGGSGTARFRKNGVLLEVLHGGAPVTAVPLTYDGVDSVDAAGIVLQTTGAAEVELTLTGCGGAESVSFDVYIDPSGKVLDRQSLRPVAGAEVTLLRSDEATGPFTVVPDGSTIMSPANRQNPMRSQADGYYGWLTLAGFYKVRVTDIPAGCSLPPAGQPWEDGYTVGAGFVESLVLPVPPEQTGIDLPLDCNQAPAFAAQPAGLTVDATSPAGAVVTYPAPSAQDPEQGQLTSSCSPVSGGTFRVGPHTVTCTAVDDGGLQAVTALAVQVRGAAEQLTRLRAAVVAMGLTPRGAQDSLTSKIDAATTALTAGNRVEACGALRALLNHVGAQRGKHYTAAQAGAMTADATRIRAVLGC